MELSAVARVVLDLLVTRTQLGSADAWLESLSEELSCAVDEDETLQSTSPLPSDQILQAVDGIVPHLSDYKTFSKNLCGLLKFCQQQCGVELFAEMICKWLASTSPSAPPTQAAVAFRIWLYQYIQVVNETMLAVDAHQYKQSLLLAALREPHSPLQYMLVRHIDANVGSLEGTTGPQDTAPPNREQEAMALLVFCWQNADDLSQSVALCAAKFSAMAASTSLDTTEVFAFLRWARVFKPLFFVNFVEYVAAAKVFSRSRLHELQLPQAVEQLLQSTTKRRSSVLHQLQASQARVRQAFETKSLHLHVPSESQAESMDCSETITTTDEALAFVAQDLAVVHSDVFSYVLAVYVSLTSPLLLPHSLEKSTLASVTASIQTLFTLLALRSDASSLFALTAAVIDLQVASHPAWLQQPQFFQQIVSDLSEQFILETDTTKKWVQRILLHQLLLECDGDLLLPEWSSLKQRLPSSIYPIVTQRFAS